MFDTAIIIKIRSLYIIANETITYKSLNEVDVIIIGLHSGLQRTIREKKHTVWSAY